MNTNLLHFMADNLRDINTGEYDMNWAYAEKTNVQQVVEEVCVHEQESSPAPGSARNEGKASMLRPSCATTSSTSGPPVQEWVTPSDTLVNVQLPRNYERELMEHQVRDICPRVHGVSRPLHGSRTVCHSKITERRVSFIQGFTLIEDIPNDAASAAYNIRRPTASFTAVSAPPGDTTTESGIVLRNPRRTEAVQRTANTAGTEAAARQVAATTDSNCIQSLSLSLHPSCASRSELSEPYSPQISQAAQAQNMNARMQAKKSIEKRSTDPDNWKRLRVADTQRIPVTNNPIDRRNVGLANEGPRREIQIRNLNPASLLWGIKESYSIFNSRFLGPAQDILEEVSPPLPIPTRNWPNHGVKQQYSLPRAQMLKLELHQNLDALEQRYQNYKSLLKGLESHLDSKAGPGAGACYTALAYQAISRHFRQQRPNVQVQQGRRRRGLPRAAVAVLRAWMFNQFLHPYPKDLEKWSLAKETGLTRNQVCNWFINARVRIWKPLIENLHQELHAELEATRAEEQGSRSSGDQIFNVPGTLNEKRSPDTRIIEEDFTLNKQTVGTKEREVEAKRAKKSTEAGASSGSQNDTIPEVRDEIRSPSACNVVPDFLILLGPMETVKEEHEHAELAAERHSAEAGPSSRFQRDKTGHMHDEIRSLSPVNILKEFQLMNYELEAMAAFDAEGADVHNEAKRS